MITFKQKQDFLLNYLFVDQKNYHDNFRNDFLFYIESGDINIKILDKLKTKKEIIAWVDKLLSIYHLKYENEMNLKEFLLIETTQKH
ncbi:hypothetical protein RCZ04_07180 [Capnocytophaga sp. HP1101]